jgi:ADP-ribosylglycohydrolase
MRIPAWRLERQLRDAAVPLDRRLHERHYAAEFEIPCGDALIDMFWSSHVPGSGAPEIPYQSMIQAKANQGYDVSQAEELLFKGLLLHEAGKKDDLRVVTTQILAALYEAPLVPTHEYHRFHHPETWEAVVLEMPANDVSHQAPDWDDDFPERIYQGWFGQLAGGSFGTAIEGYTGTQITNVYGVIDHYLTPPETTNDDVVYELVLLDVFERLGRELTSEAIGLEWVRQIPFGWSAEWVALRNLSLGVLPPQSGAWHNPYSDWIGAQMRGMVCGMLAPSWPLEAARLAYLDGVVSHARNGVYGEMYAAVLTTLAFTYNDPRELVKAGIAYLPQRSQYAEVVQFVLEVIGNEIEPTSAWKKLEKRFERYNWIHAYPNIAAVLFALWYGEGDFTKSMSLLAQAGNDVDCNAGLVGNVLGIMHGVPSQWAHPLGDLLETYIKGKERLSIQELAEKTARLAKVSWPAIFE